MNRSPLEAHGPEGPQRPAPPGRATADGLSRTGPRKRVEHLVIASGRAALEAVPALRAALDGEGPLLVPTADKGTRLTSVTQAEGLPADAAVAIGTSGSTGTPKLAVLSAAALRGSAAATEKAMGGPGQWTLALPPHHIAGLQVMLRSLAAGYEPVPVERTDSFSARHVVDALRRARVAAPDARRYTSFVPTQLGRLLATPEGLDVLRAFDGILVGGAATPAEMIQRCRSEGVRVLTTYGMSETCGGCVYDAVPLDGVQVRLEPDETGAPAQGRDRPPALETERDAGSSTATPDALGPNVPVADHAAPARVVLGGVPVAHGYLQPIARESEGHVHEPADNQPRDSTGENPSCLGTVVDAGVFFVDEAGTRWFRTDDLGRLAGGSPEFGWEGTPDHAAPRPNGLSDRTDSAPRLVLEGRVDDMIVTGGLKVLPRVVERALEPHLPEGATALVVGVPDERWGQTVGAVLVPAVPAGASALEARVESVLAAAAHDLPGHARLRRVRVLPTMPLKGPGKPDREAVRRSLTSTR